MSTLIPSKSDVMWFVFIFGLSVVSCVLPIMKDRGAFAPLAEMLATLE